MTSKKNLTATEKELFKKASYLYENGKINDALPILKSLYESNPASPVLTATLANTFWDLGDNTKAEKLFYKAVSLSQKSERISLGLFHFLWEKGDRDNAVREIKRFTENSILTGHYLEIASDINQKTEYYIDIIRVVGRNRKLE